MKDFISSILDFIKDEKLSTFRFFTILGISVFILASFGGIQPWGLLLSPTWQKLLGIIGAISLIAGIALAFKESLKPNESQINWQIEDLEGQINDLAGQVEEHFKELTEQQQNLPGYYYIVAKHSGKILSVRSGGDDVWQWGNTGDDNQKWKLQPVESVVINKIAP